MELRFTDDMQQMTSEHKQQLQAVKMELDRAIELGRQKVSHLSCCLQIDHLDLSILMVQKYLHICNAGPVTSVDTAVGSIKRSLRFKYPTSITKVGQCIGQLSTRFLQSW